MRLNEPATKNESQNLLVQVSCVRVLVTGATGFIGTKLVAELVRRGNEVVVTSRNPDRAKGKFDESVKIFSWKPLVEALPGEAIDEIDGVVNLMGEPIDQRWTEKAKAKIYESRITVTRKLVEAIGKHQHKPSALVNASAVGYYGPRGDEEVDEDSEPGDDFLADLTSKWEQEALNAGSLNMRVVTVRTGVVLSPDGGALARMLTPFKLGLGGPIGNGRHYMPWIHIDDLVSLFAEAVEDDRYHGPVNATAPNPVTNREFSKKLGQALGRPALLRLPTLILRIIYGEMSQIVTTGARAVPKFASMLGFNFSWPDLGQALSDLVE